MGHDGFQDIDRIRGFRGISHLPQDVQSLSPMTGIADVVALGTVYVCGAFLIAEYAGHRCQVGLVDKGNTAYSTIVSGFQRASLQTGCV